MHRVLLVTPRFPPFSGGAETYAAELVSHLPELGWAAYVATDGTVYPYESGSDEHVEVFGLAGHREQLADPRRMVWRTLQFALLDELEQRLRDRPPVDLVHANSIEGAILGRIVADDLGVPLVATIHEHAPQAQSFGFGRCRFAFVRLGIDALIAPSEFYRQRALLEGFPAERLHLIPHGVSATRLRATRSVAEQRAAWGASDDEWVAVLVGRVYQPKGVIDLVHAAARLRSQDRRFRAVVVGPDGPSEYAQHVRDEIARLDLGAVVRLDGPRPPEEMGDALRAADAVVAPSLTEGFGLGVAEAMLLGKPVVTARVGGLAEIITDGVDGLLVPPGDPAALATAIGRLMADDNEAARLARTGAATVAARFSAVRMARQTVELYEALKAG